ncbi:phage portal protein [Paenibacillus taichungensis]|uniref:phage portal protein n=1 Tax=Paenibacillus taichungensis TaxID=484184 RepID=UPI002DB631BF|nr:phage portal protein [Paenibacillus taichungensis]MEC0110414.1 phage portal protein [Paenibacillus taichungensis]MEC0200090.1 phage portal protein [Paenibacillus taichungensis]
MKWHQRLRGAVGGAVKAAAAGWKGAGFNFSSWAGRTFWGIDNSKLASNENIFSVVTKLANTVSSLPLKLYKDYEIVTDHPVSDLLIHSPNPNMGGSELINKLEVARNETGNGYAIIGRDIRYQPTSITPVESAAVTPVINTDDNVLWYEVRGVKNTYYVHNIDMIHVKHITGTSRWQGINPLDVLRNTIQYDKAVQEFSLSEMQKKDSFILSYQANVDKEKRQKIVDDFKRFYADNGGILFKEPGVEIKEIDKKYFSSDTLASERITRSRVANVFNVPVSFLNDSEGQSYASNEQMQLQFVQMKLTPDVRQYEQEFNRKLLRPEERRQGFYWKLNMGALLRGDSAARAALYHSGLRDGWLSRDEVRVSEDKPPRGGAADQLWISGDMYPLDMDPTLRKTSGSGTTTKGGEKEQ